MDEAHILYMGDIPANTQVYRTAPEGHWEKGKWIVTNGARVQTVSQIGQELSGRSIEYERENGERFATHLL